MPTTYTHYRFGAVTLPKLKNHLQERIQKHRRLFDVGQHGPDFFFYYNPLKTTAVGHLGHTYHIQTGRTFFTNALLALGAQPEESALVYLWGVLGHFTLDSICHPYVNACDEEGICTHTAVEAELDRLFLELDGKIPAIAQKPTTHLHLTKEDCERIAPIYPPVTGSQLYTSMNRMRGLLNLLSAPKGFKRFAMLRLTKLADATDMIMATEPLENCKEPCEELHRRFDRAAALYPKMFAELEAYRRALFSTDAPNPEACAHLLSADFDRAFG